MNNIPDFDSDGFQLEFEDDTTEDEKKYFVKTYTNVNTVAERRLHCTCCDTHIGTAPSAEKIIRMHPVLRVSQCIKCYRFYNSGEFDKGEDGSELYCRWCGQGGDVYCCSDCPYVFCKKCIVRNLTRVALNDVTSNENWKCFSCAPKILYHLRAQHWALVNFIEKQKKKLTKLQKTMDPDEYADAMNNDVAECCKSKKKSTEASQPKKRKHILADDSDNDSVDSNWSRRKKKKTADTASRSDSDAASVDSNNSARRKRPSVAAASAVASIATVAPATVVSKTPTVSAAQEKAVSSITKNPNIQVKKVSANLASVPYHKRAPTQPSTATVATRPPPPPPPPVQASTDAAEIDCTPDLFAFLVNHSYEQTVGSVPDQSAENSVSSSTSVHAPSTSVAANNNVNSSIIANQVIDVPMSIAQPNDVQESSPRTNVRRVARYQGTQQRSAPVYHNYNGYRIDLNSAAQQSTLRLPNGKVIHVKKQTPLNAGSNETVRYSITSQVPARGPQPLGPQPIINQQRPGPRAIRAAMPQRSGPHPVQRIPAAAANAANMHGNRMANQVRPNILNRGTPMIRGPPPLVINSVSSGIPMPQPNVGGHAHMMGLTQQQAQMQMQQMMRQQSNAAVRMPATSAGPHAVAPSGPMMNPAQAAAATPSSSGLPNLPRTYGTSPIGRARGQLERQIFNAIQICHQIDGKLKTLMNSNAYKNVQKMHDIKELYIHLSYLFTYTNGRFQSVHDKCMEDMRKLGFKNDATSLSSGNVIDKYGSDVDEDDLEIVEPNHQTIDLDSDDERTPEKSKSKNTTPHKNTAAAAAATTTTPTRNPNAAAATSTLASQAVLDISSSTEHVESMECDVDISSLLQIDMNEQDDDDENGVGDGESLLRRMNDDVGIATPPDFEQQEEINIQNDIKLNSKVTVNLNPVEKDFPDLMEKAKQKMNAMLKQAAEEQAESAETEKETHIEPQSEIDGPQPQQSTEPVANETDANQKQSVQEASVSKTSNDAAEIVNLDDSVESNNDSDVECTNSNVADADQLPLQKEVDQQNGEIGEIEDDEQPSASQPSSQKERNEEVEAEKDVQNKSDLIELIEDDDDDELPQQPESQTEPNETNGDVHEEVQTDFTENEAKSIDDNDDNSNSNDCGDKEDAPNDTEHGEITSTNETVDDNDAVAIDAIAASPENDIDAVEPINLLEETDDMQFIAEEVITTDDAVEILANDVVIAADDCVALEETVGEDTGGGSGSNEQQTNDVLILPELGDDLVTEEINDVISTSASLDVSTLLESGDFENISSPEAF